MAGSRTRRKGASSASSTGSRTSSRWLTIFNKSATIDEFFSLSRSRQELVPMMQQRAFHAVVQRDGYRAIRLPYAVRTLAMIVALPDEVDGLAAMSAKLDTTEFTALTAGLRAAPARLTALSLPRFKAEFSADLKQPFQLAGMRLAFDLHRADFSGLTGLPSSQAPAAIDQIAHRAVIDVAEEATEAAAATAVAVITSAAPRPIEPVRFRVDRPFLYYIVDDTTGAVLFQGRIVDPR
jgi:serpin B